MSQPTTKESLAAYFAALLADGRPAYPLLPKALKIPATANSDIINMMLGIEPSKREELIAPPGDWYTQNVLFTLSPKDLYLSHLSSNAFWQNMHPGVYEMSEQNEKVVMTDTQMAGRGLYYDAIRGGIVKRDLKPVAMSPSVLANRPECIVMDDPISDAARKGPKKVVKKDYSTIGVRFLRGDNLHKVYTYRIRKGAKVHLGMELVARTDSGDTVVVVTEIHKTPQDNGAYYYKFIDQKVAPL
jgi:hypothetical protein